MKETGTLPGEHTCWVCTRTLVDTAYACLQPTCVESAESMPGVSYVQRGTWFCRDCYRWHLEAAHAVGNLEVLRYLDPERYPE